MERAKRPMRVSLRGGGSLWINLLPALEVAMERLVADAESDGGEG